MRGYPPVHIFLCIIAFAAFAIPLARLTFARPAFIEARAIDETSTTAAQSNEVATTIRVRLAHIPSSLSLKLGEKELLPADAASHALSEIQVPVNLPSDGIELFIQANWPDHTPDTAVTVELEPDGLETQSQTRWSNGSSLDEILPYQWKS